jgi:hypothetical protein
VLARSKKQDLAASILRERRDKIANQYSEPTIIPAPHNVLLFILKYDSSLLAKPMTKLRKTAREVISYCTRSTEELHISGLTGTVSHPDMQKIRINGFFFENSLHWQSKVQLLLFYSMYLRLNLSTTPHLKF